MNRYYNINYSPSVGFEVIYKYLHELPDVVPLYNIFILFPLFFDEEFLSYILSRKRTFEFHKLVNDYVNEHKNNYFWIDYDIKYRSLRRLCFESIYLGCLLEAILINHGISQTRKVDIPRRYCKVQMYNGIKKLAKVTANMPLKELIEIMKIGE